jgi:hypothetical protein
MCYHHVLKCFFLPKLDFFGNSFEFCEWQKSLLKNQYLTHSESKSYQINSIKSCSSRAFQQHQMHIPGFLRNFQLQFNFQWRPNTTWAHQTALFSFSLFRIWPKLFGKDHSIFKNFCTISPKNTSWNQAHAPLRTEQNKQTTFLHIDRLQLFLIQKRRAIHTEGACFVVSLSILIPMIYTRDKPAQLQSA